MVAHTYYEQIGPQYGEIEVYNVINPFGNQSNQYIHETRVLRFEGAPVDLLMRRRLAGWTLSVLQAPIDTMRLESIGCGSPLRADNGAMTLMKASAVATVARLLKAKPGQRDARRVGAIERTTFTW